MKKILALALAIVMVLSLVACGSSTTESGSNNAQANAEAPATSEGNELTVWCWDPAFNIYAMEEAAKVYQKDHPDFKLNVVETPWDDIQTALTTAGSAGDASTLPDIFLCQDNAFQKNVAAFPDLFVDLTNSGIAFADFSQSKVAYSVVEGKNFGVPFDNGAVVMPVRVDVLEQAGYTVEDFTDITWSEYITKAQDVLAKTGIPMLSMQAGESDLIMMMMQSAGASLFDENGDPQMVGNETLKAVLEVYAELVSTGVLTQVNDWDQYISTLTTGSVASTINGCWILASIQTAEDQSGLWAITNMPRLDNISSATNYSNNGGSSWAVCSNCKNVELAMDFLSATFAGSTDLYNTILPSSGAIATYAPASEAVAYNEPQEFFGGDAIYAKIVEYSTKVPSNNTGVFYYEARNAVATALTNYINGADLDAELEGAQSTVIFAMGG